MRKRFAGQRVAGSPGRKQQVFSSRSVRALLTPSCACSCASQHELQTRSWKGIQTFFDWHVTVNTKTPQHNCRVTTLLRAVQTHHTPFQTTRIEFSWWRSRMRINTHAPTHSTAGPHEQTAWRSRHCAGCCAPVLVVLGAAARRHQRVGPLQAVVAAKHAAEGAGVEQAVDGVLLVACSACTARSALPA
jgi:hypothetical protein